MEGLEKCEKVCMPLGVQLFLLLDPDPLEHPLDPDRKLLMEHLDLSCEQAQTLQVIAPPVLADDHPP